MIISAKTSETRLFTNAFLIGFFSAKYPTVYPMSPTITNVNGAHAPHPLIISKSPIPQAPANAPVLLPKSIAPMNRGTLPRWISPPLPASGSLTLISHVVT